MQIGFSKKISETLIEDIFELIINNIIRYIALKCLGAKGFGSRIDAIGFELNLAKHLLYGLQVISHKIVLVL